MERVTTDKPKNQGGVEWGKKLGKMQKELKLKKQNHDVNELKPIEIDQKSNSFLKWEYAVAGTGLIIAAAALYYQKKSYHEQVKTQPMHLVQSPSHNESANKQAIFSDF